MNKAADDIINWSLILNMRKRRIPPENANCSCFQNTEGKQRLVAHAAYFGRLLDLCAVSGKWDDLLQYAASMVIGIRDGVFRGRGAETATDLMLCLLGSYGFQLRLGVGRQETEEGMLEAILDGDLSRLASLVQKHFAHPSA